MRIRLGMFLVALCFALSGVVAQAADTHEGKVISVQPATDKADGKLVMTDKDGKGEHSHVISSKVKVTRDDKSVELSDLKKGDSIKVTTGEGGKVTELAATGKDTTASAKETKGDADSKNSELPDFLKKLDLTAEQKDKLKAICHECDGAREAAWKEFGMRYRQAIALEACISAAMEENLTETQRKHLHQHREKMSGEKGHADHEATKSKSEASKDTSAEATKDAKKPASKVAQQEKPVIVEELTVIGIRLSPEQEKVADKIHEPYLERLMSLDERIEELHGRLVVLETQRLLKIEEILTKEQREELRKAHQQM